MGRLFGTDGVRGIANKELTPELAFKLGRSAAHIVSLERSKRPLFLIGTDTRISKDMLVCAFSAGVCSVGGNVVFIGVVPTPGIAFLTKKTEADAGVVISASHNSFEYNGIKIFDNKGLKLSDKYEDMIESLILAERDEIPTYTYSDVGTARIEYEVVEAYKDFLSDSIDTDLSGMSIALDCANGAGYEIAPYIFRNMGAEVVSMNDIPDGLNINKDCGPLHIDKLYHHMDKKGFDCTLALDGDADRLLMLDEQGNMIDGDQIMTIIALDLQRKHKLNKNTLVTTIMSNIGLDIMAGKNGLTLIKTKVGDRYVLEEMLKNNYNFGGEQSGHIILLEKNTTGDGILIALQILQIMKETGVKLSELAKEIEIYPQVLINAKVDNAKKDFIENDGIICTRCIEIEKELGSMGRILIRPSGTEPVIRVMIEGRDIGYITEKAQMLVRLIEERMN